MDNIGLMSETVNFIQGSKRNYDSSTMQGGVYFSKDSKEIFLNGESIEGFAIENVNIALNSLQYNVIEWGEVIGMSNNVRFKLSSDTPPTVGKFIKGDECILSNYKHIYYTGTKWVDSIGINADSGSWTTIE